ncbi:hypothetical protein ACGC1H_005851 [Rhizoctonia solani]
MNLTKNIATTPDSLTAAKRWEANNGASRELIILTQDAWRFAFNIVSSPVAQSTPHIYVSILPFLPSYSSIRNYYANRMREAIGVHGTGLSQRKPLLAQWSSWWTRCAACSPDGTLVAIPPGLPGNHIFLTDVSSGKIVRKLSHEGLGNISCVAFSPDGTHLASGTYDCAIWVWEVDTGRMVLGPLNGHEGVITSILFSRGGSFIISGSRDKTIRTWDAYSGKSVFVPLMGHTGTVMSITSSSDDTSVISGSADNTVRIWDIQSGRPVLDPITGHTNAVSSVAISPDDRFIASGSLDGMMTMWDSRTGGILLGPFFHEYGVSSVAISPDSAHISAGFHDGMIKVRCATTGRAVSESLRAREADIVIVMLAYSSDGTRIISHSQSSFGGAGNLCIFDVQSLADAPGSLPSHTGPILSIDISPDGKHIVSGSKDHTLCVWGSISGQLVLGPLTGHTKWVDIVRYSPTGDRILSCSLDKTLCQWDAQTGGSLQVDNSIEDTSLSRSKYSNRGFCVAAYSPNGSHIATISRIASVCVWDSSTGKMIQGPLEGGLTGRAVVFSADGSALITGWEDGTVRTWDLQSGHLVSSIQPQKSLPVSAFDFSPDRLYNVMADSLSNPSSATIYQHITQTGERMSGFSQEHTKFINSIRFSHDGTRIVSGSDDKAVHIWDTQTGVSMFGPLIGHSNVVRSVAYSPDSAYIASASEDGTISTWNATIQPNLSPISKWQLNKDGWVVDGKSRRLIWVPPDLRDCLLFPRNIIRISSDGYVRLDFDSALIEKLWDRCWLAH